MIRVVKAMSLRSKGTKPSVVKNGNHFHRLVTSQPKLYSLYSLVISFHLCLPFGLMFIRSWESWSTFERHSSTWTSEENGSFIISSTDTLWKVKFFNINKRDKRSIPAILYTRNKKYEKEKENYFIYQFKLLKYQKEESIHTV